MRLSSSTATFGAATHSRRAAARTARVAAAASIGGASAATAFVRVFPARAAQAQTSDVLPLPAFPELDISAENAPKGHVYLVLDADKPVVCVSAPTGAWLKRLVARILGGMLAAGVGAALVFAEKLVGAGGAVGAAGRVLLGETWKKVVLGCVGAATSIYLLFFAGKFVSDDDLRQLRRDVVRVGHQQSLAEREVDAGTVFGKSGFLEAVSALKKFADPTALAALAQKRGWDTIFRVATPREIRRKFVREVRTAAELAPPNAPYLGVRLAASFIAPHLADLRAGGALLDHEHERLAKLTDLMDRTDAKANDVLERTQRELKERTENAAVARDSRISDAKYAHENSPAKRYERELEKKFEAKMETLRQRRDAKLAAPGAETREVLRKYDDKVREATEQKKRDRDFNKIGLKMSEEQMTSAIVRAKERFEADVKEAKAEIRFEERMAKAEQVRHEEHLTSASSYVDYITEEVADTLTTDEIPDHVIPKECRPRRYA